MPADVRHPNALLLDEIYRDLTRLTWHTVEDIVLHPATRDITPAARTPVRGRAAVEQWERELVQAAGGALIMDVSDISANDYFGTVLGTLTAQFVNGPHSQPFCGVWRFREGKIAEHWENVYRPALLAKALGTSWSASANPQPAPAEEGAASTSHTDADTGGFPGGFL
ncbi:hypothetical protein AB0F39_35855 [Streptomyces murinus]|uniref:nuclear transport factor 2 family protein n=1 Tax=Streptomyces murinus TaxID=33900 RepID=UPI00340F6AD6